MLLVYIAGQIHNRGRVTCDWQKELNTRKAEALAQKVWKNGMVAICPHKNTERWGNFLTHMQFLRGDFEIIARCDAVLTVDNWKDSCGAIQEVEVAMSNGVPVFHNIHDLKKFRDR